MCDYKKIEGIIDEKLSPMSKAIIKLSATTEVLEQSMVKLEKSHEKFFEAMINQQGLTKEIERVDEKSNANRKEIDVIYKLIGDRDKEERGRLFKIVMYLIAIIIAWTIGKLM